MSELSAKLKEQLERETDAEFQVFGVRHPDWPEHERRMIEIARRNPSLTECGLETQ